MFSTHPLPKQRATADIAVLPFWQEHKKNKEVASPAGVWGNIFPQIESVLKTGDFTGKVGETVCLYAPDAPEPRLLLLGLGAKEGLSMESLRKAGAQAAKEAKRRQCTRMNFFLPLLTELRTVSASECLMGLAEGLLLANYQWKHSQKEKASSGITHVAWIGIQTGYEEDLQQVESIAEGVYFARDLVNGNAEDVTPAYLATCAEKIAQRFSHVKATIFDKKRIVEEKMGLFLAVAQGAAVEPAFIILSYKGFPKSKDHTVLVGKGVTFDTGGLNLKPTGSIENMRDDMAGAAAVLATVATAAALKLKQNVTAVIAATDNAIDARSFKPGDVYTGYTGTTVEIGNTDAEGRLTLADALAYSIQNLKPSRLIDLATLTGAMVVALGENIAGLFCNEESLSKQLLEASTRTGEVVWRLPLHAPYKELIKSDIADLKNTGGRPAGGITAALFLQEFVKDIPWAHLDIAGPAFVSKEGAYHPKNGVGFGVRLLMDFLLHREK